MKLSLILKIIVAFLLLTNFLRLYILVEGIIRLGRMPVFKDQYYHPKASIFDPKWEEYFLIFGNLVNLFLIVIAFIILVYDLFFQSKRRINKPLFATAIILITFEVLVRFSLFYDYIMYS